MTQTPMNVMDMFTQPDEKSDLYLEKPVDVKVLSTLLKILNIFPSKQNDEWIIFKLQFWMV